MSPYFKEPIPVFSEIHGQSYADKVWMIILKNPLTSEAKNHIKNTHPHTLFP